MATKDKLAETMADMEKRGRGRSSDRPMPPKKMATSKMPMKKHKGHKGH